MVLSRNDIFDTDGKNFGGQSGTRQNGLTGGAAVTRTPDGDASVRIGAPGDDHCTRGEWYALLAHDSRQRPQLHSRVSALRHQSLSLLMDPSMHSHFGGVHHLVRLRNDRRLRRVVRAVPRATLGLHPAHHPTRDWHVHTPVMSR